ncbi:uncharacterized protein LOC120840815 [Ixodes scapularis]|uniref:uncharacterized protein LOC120840815 n=1 Tax=Ixodes scapularis TaxID=6945 RepID=UPI001C387CD2|nr:uncharacterized protein LOC120840815 [Ixodes scapularis]
MIYLNGLLHQEKTVTSVSDADDVLNCVDKLRLCAGGGESREFSVDIQGTSKHLFGTRLFSDRCMGVVTGDGQRSCLSCKYFRQLLKGRQWRVKTKAKRPLDTAAKKLGRALRTLKRKQKAVVTLLERLNKMKAQNEQICKEAFEEQLKKLPKKQQESVRACFEASKRASMRGYKYNRDWLLECIILRMKSARLYEHLRRHKILVMPGRTCLLQYVKNFKATFGFNGNLLRAVKAKTRAMDEMKRHGGLVLDEMKLSAHLDLSASSTIQGFVDLGSFTPKDQRHTKADHGLVLMFQPFVGKWTQVIGVFASSGNVKADLLTKIVTEAIILCEQSGLLVDYVCCDGASWNRAMWHNFGVHGSATSVRCKAAHPSDSSRFVYFISDVPHLVKCVRNQMMKTGFNTQNGRVHWEHVVATWKCDRSDVTLKAAYKLTRAHVFPNGFEKMRVDLAFQVFSPLMLRAFMVHQKEVEQHYPNLKVTYEFVALMVDFIRVMTSRFPARALRPGKAQEHVIDTVLAYLDDWERHANGRGFLSRSTSEGLRVTLQSTKELLAYRTQKVGFQYLMTSHLSQDCIERLFGIVRQSAGANDNPTPAQFCVIMRCLSFCSLVKSTRTGNVEPGVLESLLSPQADEVSGRRDSPEPQMDISDLGAVDSIVDHLPCVSESSDAQLIYYAAGYAARKKISTSKCEECKALCLLKQCQVPETLPAAATKEWDMGGLLYPSKELYKLILTLENKLTQVFSTCKLHAGLMVDVVSALGGLPRIGCPEHAECLTKEVTKFYCVTRLHFFLKGKNKTDAEKKKKMQKNV